MGKYRVGIIGVGNMGEPLLKGAVKLFGPEKVTFFLRSEDRREELKKLTKAVPSKNNRELTADSDIVIICVKPQVINEVMSEMEPVIFPGQIVVSVAAGVTMHTISTALSGTPYVIRVMPNVAAAVNEGMSCMCVEESLDKGDSRLKDVIALFESTGRVEILPEKLMDVATCAGGSSPAYVYMFIEALADSAVKYGIPRAAAYRIVAQTVMGSAKLMLETGDHPAALKDKVCSPGGTTIAGVAALEECGFRNAIMKATDACYDRGRELGKK